MKIKKSYLLILSVITIIVAVTGIFSVGTAKQELPETKTTVKQKKIVEEAPKALQEEIKEKEPIIVEEPLEFIMPVKGEIIKEFSNNKLVYSNTLKDFRTHNAIDIKGSILEKVNAVEKGTVIKCYKDSLMGNTIVIGHKDGYESIYQNLSTLEMVFEGKEIKKGETISGIGDTALLETGDEAHLHFEMKKNGNIINPLEIISPER